MATATVGTPTVDTITIITLNGQVAGARAMVSRTVTLDDGTRSYAQKEVDLWAVMTQGQRVQLSIIVADCLAAS